MTVPELLESLKARRIELWFEGDRLRFRAPQGALSAMQRSELVSHKNNILAELRAVAETHELVLPVSFSQRSLWFLHQQCPDSAAYNVGIPLLIDGNLNVAALREALQSLVDRHAALRTSYDFVNGTLSQRVAGARRAGLEQRFVVGMMNDALQNTIEGDHRRPFDLLNGPVFRFILYARSEINHVLLLAFHHIAVDGWSGVLLVEQLLKIYHELTGGPPANLARQHTQYADYARWQEEMLAGPEGNRLWEYWRSKLAAPRQRVDLSTDYPRPTFQTFAGASLPFKLDKEITGRVNELARDLGVTPFVMLLASFHALLFHLTGTNDLIVGTPTLARSKAEFMDVVGDFVNSVPLRSQVRSGMTFRELVRQLGRTVAEALDFQEFPFPLLIERLAPERDASRSPLFDTFFVFPKFSQTRDIATLLARETATGGYGLRLSNFPLQQQEGQFDLALHMAEQDETLHGEFKFRTDLFSKTTIRSWANIYVRLVMTMFADPDTPLTSQMATVAPPASAVALIAELNAGDVHLSLDGERLRVNAPKGALDDALKARIAAGRAEIIAVLKSAREGIHSPEPEAIRRVSRVQPLPLSAVQRRFWFLEQFEQTRGANNVAVALRIDGAANLDVLARALQMVVDRHEILRMRIGTRDDAPYPEIVSSTNDLIRVVDLSDLPQENREAEGLRLCRANLKMKFDFTKRPPAVLLLVRLAPEVHLVSLCMHHIIADGWSISIALQDFAAFYSALKNKSPPAIAPLSVQYVDYAAWENDQVRIGLFNRQLGYWKTKLAAAPAVLELPTDRVRPPTQSFLGGRIDRTIDPVLANRLKRFSEEHDVTPFMTVLAAWQVVLHRLSGQDDIVVGTPVANRGRPELEQVVGPFVNTLALRADLSDNPSFIAFLDQVRKNVIEAIDNREIPFDMVVEAVNPRRGESHSPIFQVLFALHNFPIQASHFAGLQASLVKLETEVARLDLSLDMVEYEGKLLAVYEYATDLFDNVTIERVHDYLVRVLSESVTDATARVRDLPLLGAADEHILTGQGNGTAIVHDRSLCVHMLLERAAGRTPDAPAVTVAGETYSYRAIEERANRLAHLLRCRGIGPGALVALCLDRSIDMPVAMAAVLKAGAAYVPLELDSSSRPNTLYPRGLAGGVHHHGFAFWSAPHRHGKSFDQPR